MRIFEVIVEREKVKNPNQKLALYNPDGKTYRQEPMPTLEPDPVDVAEPLSSIPDEPYEPDFDKADLKRALTKHFDKLTDNEQTVIKLRFWEEMTLEEISKELKLSQGRIRQIESKAIWKLSKLLGRDKKSDYIESFQLDEGLGNWIEKKMDQLLGNADNQDYGNSPAAVDRAMDAAPPNLPDDIAEKLVNEFLKKKEHEAALAKAALAQRTTVEKLKPYLMYFVGNFVERWRRIPAKTKRDFWKDLLLAVFRLLMFILQAMAKSKR
jgi:RNA polymerase sigma factor (sigma-70 family)